MGHGTTDGGANGTGCPDFSTKGIDAGTGRSVVASLRL